MNSYAATIMRRDPRRASPFVRDGALDARVGKGWAARAAPAAVSQADFSAHHAARSCTGGRGLERAALGRAADLAAGSTATPYIAWRELPAPMRRVVPTRLDGGLPVFPGQLFVISCLLDVIQAVIPLLRPFVPSPLKS